MSVMDPEWSTYRTSLHALVSGGGISYTRLSTMSNQNRLISVIDESLSNSVRCFISFCQYNARIHPLVLLAPVGPQWAFNWHRILKMQLIDLYPNDSVPRGLSGHSREDHCLNAGG